MGLSGGLPSLRGADRFLAAAAMVLLLMPIANSEALVIGGDYSYPPYEFLDEAGQPTGYNVELTRALSEVMGLRVEIRLGPWGEIREALESGGLDAIHGMFYSPERDRVFDFTPAHTVVYHAMFAREDSPAANSIDDLRGKEIIVMRGDIMHDFVLEHDLTDDIITVPDQASALRLLASGRHDYALVARLPGLYWIRDLGLSNLETVGPLLVGAEYCYAVREGEGALAARLSEGLAILHQTGRHRAIYNKWLLPLETPKRANAYTIRIMAAILGTLLLLLLLFVLWSWSLRIQVAQRTRQLEMQAAERQRALDRLRHSERQKEAVLSGLKDVVVEFIDRDMRIVWTNTVGHNHLLCGADQEHDVVGRRCYELIGSTNAPCEGCTALRALETAEAQETEMVWPDGRIFEMRSNPLTNDAGEATHVVQMAIDITERKQMEQEIQAAHNIVSHSPAVAFLWRNEPGWPVEFVSVNVELLLGYTREEFFSGAVHYEDAIHPEDAVRVASEVAHYSAQTGRLSFAHEPYRLVTKEGRIIWVDDRTFMRRNADGQISHYQGVVMDVSDRMAAQEALRDALSRSEQGKREVSGLLNAAQAVLAASSFEERITAILRAGRRALGAQVGWCRIESHPGKAYCATDTELPMAASDVDALRETLEAGTARSSGVGAYCVNAPGIAASGVAIDNYVFVPIAMEGRPMGAFVLVNKEGGFSEHDLELTAAFADLAVLVLRNTMAQEQLARLGTAIDQAGEAVWVTDTTGRIQYVNPASETMTGHTQDEAEGATPEALGMGADSLELLEAAWAAVRTGRVWRGQLISRRKNGELYETECVFSPARNAAGGIANFVLLTRDVTRERGLERRLQQAQKLEAVGTLAGGIAHDFNNILQSIVGFNKLARQHLDQKETVARCLEEVATAGSRAAALVNQILTFSRGEEQEFRALQLQPVLKETLRLIEGSISEGLTIERDIDPQCGPILGDATQLHQVIMNLCINAVQAMGTERGVLNVGLREQAITREQAIHLPGVTSGPHAVLTVSDTGPGLDEETQKRIFEPYFTTKSPGDGSGLGLATVHGIVTAHHGGIGVDSELGRGARFSVYLPICAQDATAPASSDDEREPPRGHRERVLVVDDEPSILRFMEMTLEEGGYRVQTFASSEEALSVVEKSPENYDLVILDAVMPPPAGRELARCIHDRAPDLPIILCTGQNRREIEGSRPLEEDGISYFVAKPVKQEVLLHIVEEALRGCP